MEKMRKKEFSFEELIRMVHEGNFVLPEIQREFVWDLDGIVDLWDSIYRGYPIGQLLFWQAETSIPTYDFFDDSKEDPYLFVTRKPRWYHRTIKENKGKIIVLDGQQRLTSLLLGTLPGGVATKNRRNSRTERKYLCIYVGDNDTDGDNDTKMFEWKDSEEEDNYISVYKALESRKQSSNIRRLKKCLRDKQYAVPVDYVHGEKVEDVIEIFRRLNNNGRAMSKSELFLAMWFGSSHAEELRTKIDDIRVSFGNSFDVKDKTITQLLITIFGKNTDKTGKINYTSETFKEITKNLPKLKRAVKTTVKFLNEDCGIYSNGEMTSHNLFIPIVHMFYHFNCDMTEKMRLELRCFVYRALIFELFAKSTDTTLVRLKESIEGLGKEDSFIKSLRDEIKNQCFMDIEKSQILDGKIDELIGTLEKGSKTNQILLLLRQEPANVDREMFEQDHLVAVDLFDPSTAPVLEQDRREKFGIRKNGEIIDKYKLEKNEIKEWGRISKRRFDSRNKLPNLWLLEKSENASKGKRLLNIWFDGLAENKQKKYLEEIYLTQIDGHKVSFEDLKIINYEKIYETRETQLFKELKKLLSIPR